MFAVVEIAGSQVEVKPNAIFDIPFMEGEPGDKLEFSEILMFNNDENTVVGTPFIEGKVSAKIVEHFKGDKLKGYRKLNGHRQQYTKIEITDIIIK
jgi:large subunit ribosomal protein L21